PRAPGPPTAAPGARDAGAGAPTCGPGPRDAGPAGQRPGKVSVTMTAGSAPGEGGRGRRVSCTVALAVAGALAAVTVGVGFLLRPMLGGDGDAGGGNAYSPAPSAAATTSSGASPSTSSSASSSPGEGTAPTAVPARYLGTWEGQGTALDGNLPIGTFRLTVHAAGPGEELGRMTQTDQLGGVCTDVLTLKKVTRTQIVATSVGAEGNHDGCNPAPHSVELTPVGDDLTYTSDSSAEGNPVARMSKVR
ncbi:serine/threonine protein kinase, partial [Streptomyces sp. NPDC058964]